MRKILCISLFAIVLIGCSKKKDDVVIVEPPVAVVADTLGAGWTKIASPQNENNLADIFFTDSQNGYAVGQSGIYKSINAGNTWVQVLSSNNLVNMSSSGTRSVFVGAANRVFNTQNGNAINASQVSLAPNDVDFYDCFFSTSNTCYATSKKAVYKSVDGGLTFAIGQNFNDDAAVTALSFLNDNVGYMGRNGKLYKTIDGGSTWTNLNIATSGFISTIKVINANFIYVANNNGVYKSSDGGITFSNIFNFSNGGFPDIDFIDASTGYLSSFKQIFKTIDGGANWVKVVGLSTGFFIEIHFTDATHGWACGGGNIYRYSN